MNRLRLLFLSFLFALGCGTPGAPRPPSLGLPKPVEDLQAVRVGDKVYLRWTVPTETNDGELIGGRLGETRVCRTYPARAAEACDSPVAVISRDKAEKGRMSAVDDLSSVLGNTNFDFLNYNVEVLNTKGRSAGPSNAATIFVARGVPAQRDLRATVQSDGVKLEWMSPPPPEQPRLKTEYRISVQRIESGAAEPVVLATSPYQAGAAHYVDRTIEWERPYSYRILGVTRVLSLEGKLLAEFTGEASAPVSVTPHDTFPPKAPSGVQAVFADAGGSRSIDLTWTPNDESDLSGYNVYRQIGTETPVKINSQPVQTPAFKDANVRAGQEHIYFVTAVDARGNESARSEAAREIAP